MYWNCRKSKCLGSQAVSLVETRVYYTLSLSWRVPYRRFYCKTHWVTVIPFHQQCQLVYSASQQHSTPLQLMTLGPSRLVKEECNHISLWRGKTYMIPTISRSSPKRQANAQNMWSLWTANVGGLISVKRWWPMTTVTAGTTSAVQTLKLLLLGIGFVIISFISYSCIMT